MLEEWSQVPSFVHHPAYQKSSSRIDTLIIMSMHNEDKKNRNDPTEDSSTGMTCGLQRLFFSDITTEGVDFHCSSVLKATILDNSRVVQECLDFLSRQIYPLPSRWDPIIIIPNTKEERLGWLEEILKLCMWKFSAGVNFRVLSLLTLSATKDSENDETTNNNIIQKKDKDIFLKHF